MVDTLSVRDEYVTMSLTLGQSGSTNGESDPIHPNNRNDLNRKQIGTMFFTGKTSVKHRTDWHD